MDILKVCMKDIPNGLDVINPVAPFSGKEADIGKQSPDQAAAAQNDPQNAPKKAGITHGGEYELYDMDGTKRKHTYTKDWAQDKAYMQRF